MGWPNKHQLEPAFVPYWTVRGSLTLDNELLRYGNRIVVPSALQRETIDKIHARHQGVERCQLRVRSSVWWPGVTAQIKQKVLQCRECAKAASTRREPLISTPVPDHPWHVIGSELRGEKYLLVVDYFSRFPEVTKVATTTSAAVISVLKSLFSRHGIPEVVRSHNGPQYSSLEFTTFANSYGFQHLMSSPRYPQSNGLSYLHNLDQKLKDRQQSDFNKRRRAREQPAIPDDTEVWITSEGVVQRLEARFES